MNELPVAHGVALRLRGAGRTNAVIADALGIPVGAVPSLLSVAEAKLDRLLGAKDAMLEREARNAPRDE